MAEFDKPGVFDSNTINRVKIIKKDGFHNNSFIEVSESSFKDDKGKDYLLDLELPDTVTSIKARAFKNFTNLRRIVIPSSVKSIEEYAFDGCSRLCEVVLPTCKDFTSIMEGVFANCSDLSTIKLPEYISVISKYAFLNSGITNLDLPNNIAKIQRKALGNCKSLTNVTMPIDISSDSLRKVDIHKGAFDGSNSVVKFSLKLDSDFSKDGDKQLKEKIKRVFDLRNKYFPKRCFFKRKFTSLSLVETSLVEGFDCLLKPHLDKLSVNNRKIVQVVKSEEYSKLQELSYSDILLVSVEGNFPSIFNGDSPSQITWLKHPCKDEYIPYTEGTDEDLFVEKYNEFIALMFANGATHVRFTYENEQVALFSRTRDVKTNAKEESNGKANFENSNEKKDFKRLFTKLNFDGDANVHQAKALPNPVWSNVCWKNEQEVYLPCAKDFTYNTFWLKEKQSMYSDYITAMGQLDSIYGNLGFDLLNKIKKQFKSKERKDISIEVYFNGYNPDKKNNPSSPEPKSDDPEKKKNELPELRYKPQEVSVERPDDTKALFNSLQQNQFVNLVGIGGMGKTCLANLLVKDYSKEYGNVVYSLINGSFYSDITDKDSQLKLIADRYKMSVGDKVFDSIANTGNEITGAMFRTLLNLLNEKYNESQNLWIIDVNETADYAQVREALKYMFSDKHLNENWRVLIVSRVAFIEKKELRNFITRVEDLKNSNDFLKQVFFHYLVDYTKDEDDTERYLKKNIYEDKVNNGEIVLDKILEVLFENPLLIEQLASYLRDIDPKDQQQILDLFVAKDENGNRLSQEEVCEFVKRDKKLEYEFLAQYLSSLVFFNKLDDLRQNKRNEHKEIARHLMLWPADFYKVDDIFTLMRGATFKDKDDLQKYLNYMSEQRIVEKQTDDKGVSSYKMHGLIADALRVQVLRDHKDMQGKEVSDNFRNFSQYLANIEKLKGTSSEIDNCLFFCFSQTKMTSETYLPAEFFENDERFFNAKFYNKFAGLTRDIPLYEKWYKLKLIEEVCGIEDHTQKLNKYQEYKDKSSHKVYEGNYTPSQGNEIDQDLKTEVLSQMVELRAGEFVMGGTKKYDGSPHNVKISSFYIGKYTVTQKLWKRVMGSLPDDYDYDSDIFRGDRKPVIDVNWYDCMDFIIKLNKKTGLQFRLPTEAEWEYACRCSGVENYKLDDVAWYGNNSGNQLHEVGTTNKASELIIQDMSGNVWEWCSDWYDRDYYKHSPIVDPQGPSVGSNRVNRGGSWYGDADHCRVAYRYYYSPCSHHYLIGFRLALSLQFKK